VIDTLRRIICPVSASPARRESTLQGGNRHGAKNCRARLERRANGCTYHGVSLNVAMDLAPFSWINPCGYEGLATVDMKTLGVAAALPEVQLALAHTLMERLA